MYAEHAKLFAKRVVVMVSFDSPVIFGQAPFRNNLI